jgi:hypothetical protein
MAGSNEVNLNESKVFSFISCPVLSSWRTFFHVFVFFFFQSLELYMIVWSIGLFHFINFFFFFFWVWVIWLWEVRVSGI